MNKNQPKDLGQKLDHYPERDRNYKRWPLVIFSTLLMLTSAVYAIVLLLNAWSAVAKHGRAIILSRLPLPLILLFLIVPTGLLIIIIAIVHWHNGITLYDAGMVQKKGIRQRRWFWNDIFRLDTRITYVKFAGSTITEKIMILFEDQQQKRIMLTNKYERMQDLLNKIRTKILPILYVKMNRYLSQGETIVFNKSLRAIKTGLEIKGGIIPWDAIKIPEIKKGLLYLYNKSNHQELYKININQVKNLDLLIHFIENSPNNID